MIILCTNPKIQINDEEIQWHAIRAQGAGGQNVNKVSCAVHLRFDIHNSSLPPELKTRLLNKTDNRITLDGVIVIKAQRFRTREKNLDDALERLRQLVSSVARPAKRRRPTRPGKTAIQKRLEGKRKRGQQKELRRRVGDE